MIKITKKQMLFLKKVKASSCVYDWHDRVYCNDSCAYVLNGHRVHFVGKPVIDSVDIYDLNLNPAEIGAGDDESRLENRHKFIMDQVSGFLSNGPSVVLDKYDIKAIARCARSRMDILRLEICEADGRKFVKAGMNIYPFGNVEAEIDSSIVYSAEVGFVYGVSAKYLGDAVGSGKDVEIRFSGADDPCLVSSIGAGHALIMPMRL